MNNAKSIFITSALAITLSACGGSDDDTTSTPTPTPTPTETPTPTPTPTEITASTGILDDGRWVINTTETSEYIDGSVTLVNVQSVESETVDDVEYVLVTTSGIPDYEVTMTTELVDWLNNRPLASSRPDFDDGETTAVAGEVYGFGADIGYVNDQCGVGEGQGYWPPGPACPSDQSTSAYFPVEPTPATELVVSGANTSGYAVNGVAIYSWFDGQSYNGGGVWSNLASVAEVYDVDICGGHAAGTTYHHHHFSECWARAAGEDYTGHSEIYGYIADGYPIYGPYEDTDTLAKSCWKKRDYTVSGDEEGYGCVGTSGAVAGERSCVLVDPYDPSLGVEAAASSGPTTDETVASLSGNTFTTTSGFYFQDYYYDSACSELGDEYLDQYNGHYDETLGYHYHLTIENDPENDVPATPTFPFTFGPGFAGELAENAVYGGADNAGGPPGGGPP